MCKYTKIEESMTHTEVILSGVFTTLTFFNASFTKNEIFYQKTNNNFLNYSQSISTFTNIILDSFYKTPIKFQFHPQPHHTKFVNLTEIFHNEKN